MESQRTEEQVIGGLSPEARLLVKRVLEIEREKLHVKAADATIVDEILNAVRGVLP